MAKSFPVRIPLLILVLVAFFTNGASADSETAVIRFVNTLPENKLLAAHLEKAARDVRSKSGMTVRLQTVAGPTGDEPEETFRWARAGRVDGAVLPAGVLGQASGNYLIPGLPGFLQDYQEVDAVKSKFEQLLTHEMEIRGFETMGFLEAGFVYLMSRDPIRKPSDLLGKKMWTPQWGAIAEDYVKAAGAEMVKLPFREVAAALQDGRVEVLAASPMIADSLGWTDNVRYVTDYPLLFHYGAICFPKDRWARIPESQREDIRNVLITHTAEISAESRKENEAAMERMRARGIVFVKPDPSSMPSVERTLEAANNMIRSDGLYDPRMYDRISRVIRMIRALK